MMLIKLKFLNYKYKDVIMLKSFDFVDPILAKKIHNLQIELKRVQQSRDQILNNTKLTQATRQKLLRYQTQCGNNIQKMLNQQKDKLAEYLDEQTNVISKTNRITTSRAAKNNVTINQSTRLELQGIDDSKSLNTTKTQINRKVSSFYMASTERPSITQQSRCPTTNRVKVKQLKKKVNKQQKLIKVLVTWIKIYYERQQSYKKTIDTDIYDENERLKSENDRLKAKCQNLQAQIVDIRSEYTNKTLNIIQTQKKYDQLKNENSGLKMERKQLLSNAKSLKKSIQN